MTEMAFDTTRGLWVRRYENGRLWEPVETAGDGAVVLERPAGEPYRPESLYKLA